MQSRQIKRINFLAVAALLIVSSIGDRASCQAAESWENHVFITPIPLVADPDGLQFDMQTSQVDSLTGMNLPLTSTVSPPVFPLDWRIVLGFTEPDMSEVVPVFIRMVVTQKEDSGIDWWNAWDKSENDLVECGTCTDPRLEWSPLKWASLIATDRAVPEPVVAPVEPSHDDSWFRFQFVFPARSDGDSDLDYGIGSFNATQFEPGSNTPWLDGLRVYRISVHREWRESMPRAIVMSNLSEGYDVIEVDTTKMTYEIELIGDLSPNEAPRSDFDKWLGEERADKATIREWFLGGFTR